MSWRFRGLRRAAAAVLAVWAALAFQGPARGAETVVVFDEGHGQPFRAGGEGELQLSGLAALVREAGAHVRTSGGRLSDETLAGAASLVVSGPFAPLDDQEREALRRFLRNGGRVSLMLHIGQPVIPLLQEWDVQVSLFPVREVEGVIAGNPLNFAVSRIGDHPVTAGVKSFGVFGCWGLKSEAAGVTVIGRTGPHAWLDRNGDGRPTAGETMDSLAVGLAGRSGAGEFVIFGDDAVFQNVFLREHNTALGRSLARWLAGAAPGGTRL